MTNATQVEALANLYANLAEAVADRADDHLTAKFNESEAATLYLTEAVRAAIPGLAAIEKPIPDSGSEVGTLIASHGTINLYLSADTTFTERHSYGHGVTPCFFDFTAEGILRAGTFPLTTILQGIAKALANGRSEQSATNLAGMQSRATILQGFANILAELYPTTEREPQPVKTYRLYRSTVTEGDIELMIVNAKSKRQARRIAAANAEDEGPAVWLDRTLTRIERIPFTKGLVHQDAAVATWPRPAIEELPVPYRLAKTKLPNQALN